MGETRACLYRVNIVKSRDISLLTKVRLVKAMVFPVVMYGCELDYKESWVSKNWCFWTVVLEKTLENPLDCKEIQPVNPKGNQSWIFTGRTDAEAETSILWLSDVKNWLRGKDPDPGNDWAQEETTEAEMAGWHHQLDGHYFELWELVMDREAWHAAVHGVAKSRTRLSDWTDLSAICSTMDGPRDYHANWRQTERDTENIIAII